MTLYDEIGAGYAGLRRPDPRIAAAIEAALGDAASIVNVGAGAGSYEPRDRPTIAVEPSRVMIRQRPSGAAACVQASAHTLPFADAAFDAALAVLTIHHWTRRSDGLREMARVARRRVVVFTFDPMFDGPFWLTDDYFPEFRAIDRRIAPSLEELGEIFGAIDVIPVPVPHDCRDGFAGAYWRRPHAYLDPAVRAAISSFARLGDVDDGLRRLARDLETGAWSARHGSLLALASLDLGYRLVVAQPRPDA